MPTGVVTVMSTVPVPAGLVAVIVAVSRVYRGMHFFTDVIAGAILGLVAVVLAWWMVRVLMRRGVAEHDQVVWPANAEGAPV